MRYSLLLYDQKILSYDQALSKVAKFGGVNSAFVNTNQYIYRRACPYNGSAVCDSKVKHFFLE